jgi:hypothetical protein
MKKILLLTFAFIFALSILTKFEGVSPVKAQEISIERGFYETKTHSGFIKVDNEVVIKKASVSKAQNFLFEMSELPTYKDGKLIIFDIGSTNESKLSLGEIYTLKLETDSGSILVSDLMFVTKTIATKEDLKVIDLHSADVAVTGYYVLVNNLKLEKGEQNQFLDENGKIISMNYKTLGFRGTFDGLGHNVEFYADKYGFFGIIGARACIKNVGFVNVKFYSSGACCVLAKGASIDIVDPDRALIQNVYIRTAPNQIPEGGIMATGSIPLKLFQVVLEFPGVNITHGTNDISVGALWGADYGWWNTKDNEHAPNVFPCDHEDIYIVGRIPVMHYKASQTKGFYYSPDGYLKREWMEGFAENEGVQEDLWAGNKVYKNIRIYPSGTLMASDKQNDYSNFDRSYWAVDRFGYPVWLNGIEDNVDLFISTEADKTMSVVYLEIGAKNLINVGFGINEIKIDNPVINYTVNYGEEFISIDKEKNQIVGVKEGKSQLIISTNYDGKEFSKKLTIYVDDVRENAGNNGDDAVKGGCGLINFTLLGIGSGILLIVATIVYVAFRKFGKKLK